MYTSSPALLSHTEIARSVFNEIASGHDRYYYYYGRCIPFSGDTTGSYVEDIQISPNYENSIRNNVILYKKIAPNELHHKM